MPVGPDLFSQLHLDKLEYYVKTCVIFLQYFWLQMANCSKFITYSKIFLGLV